MQVIREAFIIAIAPPSVRGVGTGGGFKLQLQEKESADMGRVLGAAYAIMGAAQQSDKVTGVFTTFSASSPQVFLDIDRVRAQILNVPIGAIFETLAINLGSAYVNDFNAYGRLFQVRAQADEDFRLENAGYRQPQGPLGHGRADPARDAGRNPRHGGAGAGAAVQPACLGAGAGVGGAGHLHR